MLGPMCTDMADLDARHNTNIAWASPIHNVTGQYQNHLGIPKSRLGRARDQNCPYQKPTETSPLAVTQMISKVQTLCSQTSDGCLQEKK